MVYCFISILLFVLVPSQILLLCPSNQGRSAQLLGAYVSASREVRFLHYLLVSIFSALNKVLISCKVPVILYGKLGTEFCWDLELWNVEVASLCCFLLKALRGQLPVTIM